MLMNMMDMMEVFQNMNETADSDGNTDPDFDPMAMMKKYACARTAGYV